MREIKFRYVFEHYQNREIKSIIISIDDMETNQWHDIPEWEDNGFQLKSRDQYTGIKDKNGKEIYEGDIVKYTQILYTDCSRTEVLIIKEPVLARMYYSDGIYLAMKIGDLGRIILPGLIDSEELEVIGNIYDNPELLEGRG